MKVSAIATVVITSILLLLVTIFVVIDVTFRWVFYLTCIGQVMIVIMVYKVLRDNYTTDKTFDDFYEDYPLSKHE